MMLLTFYFSFLSKLNYGNFYLEDFGATQNLIKKSKNSYESDKIILTGIIDKESRDNYLLILTVDIIIEDTHIIYTGRTRYWLVNFKNEKILGPFNRSDFNKLLDKTSLGGSNLEIPSYYVKYCTVDCNF